MPTCRYCLGTFSREQFIHGNGPRAQVCIRCAVEMKIATEEEIKIAVMIAGVVSLNSTVLYGNQYSQDKLKKMLE